MSENNLIALPDLQQSKPEEEVQRDKYGRDAETIQADAEFTYYNKVIGERRAQERIAAEEFAALAVDETDGNRDLKNPDGTVNWEAAFEAAPTEIQWLCANFLEASMAHSLWGVPGSGKSLFTLETIVHHVLRGDRHVTYIDSENELTRIVVDRLKGFGVKPQDLANLHFYSYDTLPPLDTPAGGKEVLRRAIQDKSSLVVIDTTSRFIEGDEDKANTFLRFYMYTLLPLKRAGVASLRLDHPGKDASRGARGSSAKFGDIDYEFELSGVNTQGTKRFRNLKCTKSRAGNIPDKSVNQLEEIGETIDGKFRLERHAWSTPKVSASGPIVPAKIVENSKYLAQYIEDHGIKVKIGEGLLYKHLEEHENPKNLTLAEVREANAHRKSLLNVAQNSITEDED